MFVYKACQYYSATEYSGAFALSRKKVMQRLEIGSIWTPFIEEAYVEDYRKKSSLFYS